MAGRAPGTVNIGLEIHTGGKTYLHCTQFVATADTVEPRSSDSHLSVSSIIQNDVQKFLKQVIPNC